MDRPDPEGTRSFSVRTLMAPMGVVALLIGIVGIGLGWSSGRAVTPHAPVSRAPSQLVTSPALNAATQSPTSTPSAAQEARPTWVEDLAGQLECDGPPGDFGMEVPARIGPFDPGVTPDEALDNVRFAYSNLPVSGFDSAVIEGDWARHRYAVDGRTKAIAVSTNRFTDVPTETRWEVVGLRACDPSEFDLADLGPMAGKVWLNAADAPARTDLITSYPGAGHCGWETTVFLTYDRRQYFRDPKHALKEYSVIAFDATSRLPADAVDTGFHTERWHLFTIPSGRAVFVRTLDGRIELWPRASQAIGCA